MTIAVALLAVVLGIGLGLLGALVLLRRPPPGVAAEPLPPALAASLAAAVSAVQEQAASERDAAVHAALEQVAVLQREQLGAHLAAGSRELAAKKDVIDSRLDQVQGELRAQMERLGQLVGQLGQRNAEQFGKVDEAIRAQAEVTQALSTSTQSLREALANPKARGQWGERMAEDVLRLAGFIEHVNYEKQTAVEGTRALPDYTFTMPKGHALYMDVKFPLSAYLRFLEAGTDTERQAHREAFLRDVRARVRELAQREYASVGDRPAVDYVLLFLPNEAIAGFIHEQDPGLIEHALGQKVVLCSPLTLFAFLGVIRQAFDNFVIEQTSDEESSSSWAGSVSSGRSTRSPWRAWSASSRRCTRSSSTSAVLAGACWRSPSCSSTSFAGCGGWRSMPRRSWPTPTSSSSKASGTTWAREHDSELSRDRAVSQPSLDLDVDDGGLPTLTVRELAEAINGALRRGFYDGVWVRGEVQGLNERNGHVYFSLADDGDGGKATISVSLFANVRFKLRPLLQRHRLRLADGMKVRIHGFPDFFAPTGRLSLKMAGIDPRYTLGELALQREDLARQLVAEGLYDAQARLALPALPLRVGLVTSVGSAAWHDVTDELARSGFGFRVLACDARVQGEWAAEMVASAIEMLGSQPLDVILLVRGGGARADLATFDSALVARAVAGCPLPVLTGLGHEVDRSVADDVAHLALKTPTACAAEVISRVRAFRDRVERAWASIGELAGSQLTVANRQLASLAGLAARETHSCVGLAEARLAGHAQRLPRDVRRARSKARACSWLGPGSGHETLPGARCPQGRARSRPRRAGWPAAGLASHGWTRQPSTGWRHGSERSTPQPPSPEGGASPAPLMAASCAGPPSCPPETRSPPPWPRARSTAESRRKRRERREARPSRWWRPVRQR